MLFDYKNILRDKDWQTFSLDEYSSRVTGFIHSKEKAADNGMPFGSIGTGHFDIESNGTIGFMTAFNSLAPRRGPVNLPLFGVSVGDDSYVLTTYPIKNYPEDYPKRVHEKRAAICDDILYFGHYPMLDMVYLLDAPIDVSSRMYVPFFPGNAKASNVPGGLVEFSIHNKSDQDITGNLCMNFPGPSAEEVGGNLAFDHSVEEAGQDRILTVRNSDNIGYCLGVLNASHFEHGGCLGLDGGHWSHIGLGVHANLGHDYRLPFAYNQPGASISTRYSLKAHETSNIVFVISWYAACWNSGGTTTSQNGKQYLHMYSRWFDGPLAVASYLVSQRGQIKKSILSWQDIIYGNENIPGWLQDVLINSLHLFTEDGVWAQATPPIDSWCSENDGLFAMNECPRGCPQMECIPCSFYSLATSLLFPELALSTLRTYKAYQYDDGAAPWIFGGYTSASPLFDLTSPVRGYQTTTNGVCYAAMADRLIRFTQNKDLVKEFYESLKKNMIFTAGLNPDPDGIISMPNRRTTDFGDRETEWFEGSTWDGMVAHVGGLHIAQLRIIERMAVEYGDLAFRDQCRSWIAAARDAMEHKMWSGDYYYNYKNEVTNTLSDSVFGYQLDGEWIVRMHGLDSVFDQERVTRTLQTIRSYNVHLSSFGAFNYVKKDSSLTCEGCGGVGAGYDPYEFFPAELMMLAMCYMQDGDREFGLELVRRCLYEIICVHSRSFNAPNILRDYQGVSDITYGNDYYQMLVVWGIPLALENKTFAQYSESDSLINRIIQAANAVSD
jgi:uncharacterized protein (DUF608 family)